VGLFFDATIPQLGLSGDLAKTYFFSKSSSEDVGKIGASVIGQKLITMTVTVVTFSVGLILVLTNYANLSFSVVASIGLFLALSIFSLFLVYYVSIRPKATDSILRFCIRVALFFRKNWNLDEFKQKMQEALATFHDGVQQLKAKPRALVLPALFAVISWGFDIGVMFLAFNALGYSVPVDTVLIVYTVTGALQAVGIGIFGVNEMIMSTSLWALGISPELSVSATLLTRAVTLWFRLIVSYGAFQWTGVKLVRQKDGNQPLN
jgi:uncharacterized protein (TIRG00374 family)